MEPLAFDRNASIEEGLERVLELLEGKKYFKARDELLKFNAVDIAELLEDIQRRQIFRRLLSCLDCYQRMLQWMFFRSYHLMTRLTL